MEPAVLLPSLLVPFLSQGHPVQVLPTDFFKRRFLIIFTVITVHQGYQSLYYTTNAQRKIRRVN